MVWHVWGGVHAGCPPQVQPARAEHPSPSAPHCTHSAPFVPQSLGSFPGSQMVPSQQPVHVVGSQAQAMFEQI
jgi:hypothetical protein